MNLLLSNDDGIEAEGLNVLAERLRRDHKIFVVAPDSEKSASSHSLTLKHPLRVKKIKKGFYAVDGTPADCVNIAINDILPKRPDLVVSGINHGANLGDDISYSGTVSAAMEGVLFNIPSIAISFEMKRSYDFGPAADFAVSTAWPATRLYNFICATRHLQRVYPCRVAGRIYQLVEVDSYRESGRSALRVEGDRITLPCNPGFVRARFQAG